MYPATTVAKALELVKAGWTVSAVSRSLGVSRAAAASLLRGLFHSDGCRVLSRVNGYFYPRYFLFNMSTDLLRLAGDTLDRIGVEWRYNRFNSISVARRASVARLDEVVGPKY